MTNQAIYPNSFEIIRFVLRCFDLKQSNKRLDDLANQKIYDPREVEVFIDDIFSENLNKYIGEKASALMTDTLRSFLKQYTTQIAAIIPVDILSRPLVLTCLSKSLFKDYLIELSKLFQTKIEGPEAAFWFSSNDSVVGAVFNWISENEPNWLLYIDNLAKEQKDMIGSWIRGKELPSATSIMLLDQQSASESNVYINWNKVKSLIFFARAIDFIKTFKLGKMLIDEAQIARSTEEGSSTLEEATSAMAKYYKNSTIHDQQLFMDIMKGLITERDRLNSDLYKKAIDTYRERVTNSEKLKNALYRIDWHDARWHVASGDLQSAHLLYKAAFDGALFVAGDGQKRLIEEALVVAASQTNPDRVFLKQLKWALILLGYDIPSVTTATPSQKFSDNIEDWELKSWRTHFDRVFPARGLFEGVSYEHIKGEFGPLIFTDISKIVPDYRNPNRKIKVGETYQRATPQLVWFTMHESYEICKKLLENGADVNVQSEVGETPILMALEMLNVIDVPYRSLDDRLFKLIATQPHSVETLNTRTQKKRLLPIISAVESGRFDVVKKILDMGADVNGRGQTDEQTPLNVCLKLIAMCKTPDRYWNEHKAMPVTPEALDSLRRHSGSLSGFSLDQQKSFWLSQQREPRMRKVQNAMYSLIQQRIEKHLSIHTMREIAKLLIKFGADVNAEHSSPIKGYTPLMLAAENNEKEIFELMLINGGDLQKKYKDSRKGLDISIKDIAKAFKSHDIIRVLEDISPYLK